MIDVNHIVEIPAGSVPKSLLKGGTATDKEFVPVL
jgi:hypothetical protein